MAFLFFYNEKSETSASIEFSTVVAPSVGFGGFFKGEWFSEAWSKEMLNLPSGCKSTALFELYSIVVASLLWGSKWSRKQIVVLCNNEATVNKINKGRSRTPAINRFLRRLTWTCVTGNFIMRAVDIPGHDSRIADALSRFKFQKFKTLHPNAKPTGLPCPPFSQTVLD